jgi:fatty acid desaturase
MPTDKADSKVPNWQSLRSLLPKEAFVPNPRKLRWVVVHLAIVLTCLIALRNVSGIGVSALISFVIGHSLACLAFVAHELSHGAVLRSRSAVYPLELLAWGLNWIPPTLWRRVHNQSHHGHANTVHDPDRQFLATEQTRSTRLYSLLFYPQKGTSPFNPLVALHFIPYILRNLAAAFVPLKKPGIVPLLS